MPREPRIPPEDYLAAIRLPPDGESDLALRKRLGMRRATLTGWRQRIPGFRAEEARIMRRRKAVVEAEKKAAGVKLEARAQQSERRRVAAAARTRRDLAAAPGQDDGAALEPRMQAFLDALRDLDDRAGAMEAAGIASWSEIQDYSAAEPRFAARYAAVQVLQLFRVEDAVRRKGAGGDVKAAQIFLQANDPAKYSSKMQINHTGLIAVTQADVKEQENWLASFRAAAKPVRQIAAEAVLQEVT